MRRTILLSLVLIIALSQPAQAQLIKHWGVMGGLTSSDHVWDGKWTMEDNQERRIGFHVGVFQEWFNHPYVSIVTELLYNQKGAVFEWPVITYDEPLGTGEFVTANARLDYFSLGILAKATIPSTAFSPYVVAGPRLDILLRYHSGSRLSMADLYEYFDPTVLGISIGAGVQTYRLFSILSFVEFRYDFDLHNSYETHCAAYCFIGQRIRNSSFDISAGIGF